MIYGTNLLIRCPVPVPVFCCLFVSEKLFWEVSRIVLIIYGNCFQYEMKTEPEGRPEGRHPASRCHPGAAQGQVMAGAHLGTSLASSRCLFAYKFIPDLKTRGA